MQGWNITIFQASSAEYIRLHNRGELETVVLARWEAGQGAMDWITDLAADDLATLHRSNGYPSLYTVQAKHLQTADTLWKIVCPPSSQPMIVTFDWQGKERVQAEPGWMSDMEVHQDKLAQCPPEAFLTVEAWKLD